MHLFSWLFRRRTELEPRTVSTCPPSTSRSRPQARRHVVEIKRNSRQLYEERGWRFKGTTLRGYYRTTIKAYEGRIDDARSKKPKFFIVDPPHELLNGPHGACFTQRSKDTYEVHWSPKPNTVNTGIIRMEHCIMESLR